MDLKRKVVDLKKLVFQSGVCFLIRIIFYHTQSLLVPKNGIFEGNKSIFLACCNLLVTVLESVCKCIFAPPLIEFLNGVMYVTETTLLSVMTGSNQGS